MCELSPDLMTEILIRLPPNPMARFKCVSRNWSSLISCRYFCLRQHQLHKQQQQHIYMSLVDKDMQCMLLSLSSKSSPDNNTCLVVDQDMCISGMGSSYMNVACGLMCFPITKKVVCVYNPTTRQRLVLPKLTSHMVALQGEIKRTWYYLGHDPVTDRYKIFSTTSVTFDFCRKVKSEHWVFVLEAGGGSWKKLEEVNNDESYHYHHHDPSSQGVFINGSVHYMGWVSLQRCVVVSIDVRSETVTTILMTHEAGYLGIPLFDMYAGIIDYGGKMAVFDNSRLGDRGIVDVWTVNKAKARWSKKKLVVQPCQKHLVHGIELVLQGTTRDGKAVLAPVDMRSQFYLLFYDMQTNDFKKVEIKGVPQVWFDKDFIFDIRFTDQTSERFIYFET
ncbi:unnamed protein product [Cochlearia groenlandica]